MDKYGYEKDDQRPGVKTAAEEGVCPICGKPVTGNPPVCVEHGSLPFEKREKDAEEKD